MLTVLLGAGKGLENGVNDGFPRVTNTVYIWSQGPTQIPYQGMPIGRQIQLKPSDVDAIVKLHAPDALFMGTASKTVVVKTEGIRTYFENALLNNRPRGAKLTDYTAVVLSDTAAAVSGLDMLTGVRDGQTFSTTGRVTFVVAKREADWQIVQFHRSLVPK
jgi:hypothetical protein